MLTPERLREVLTYDPDTGVFTRLVSMGRTPAGAKAGSKNAVRGYLKIAIDKRNYASHRLAWLYVHGRWPTHAIDHINGIKDDNRITNLRDVPHSINMQNKREKRPFQGVCYQANGYIAQIRLQGKQTYLGRYKTAEEAHRVYLETKRRLHPGCAF